MPSATRLNKPDEGLEIEYWYERGDSNPYDLFDLRILSPLRLPIPPRSRRWIVYHR